MEKILPRPTKFTLAPELLYSRTAVRVMSRNHTKLILHQQNDFQFLRRHFQPANIHFSLYDRATLSVHIASSADSWTTEPPAVIRIKHKSCDEANKH